MFKKVLSAIIALVLVFAALASFTCASASVADEFEDFEDDWFAPLTSKGALNCKMYTIRGGQLYRGKISGVTDLKGSKVGFKGTTYETKGGHFSYESGIQLTAVHVTGKIRVGYDWDTVIAATDEVFGTHGGHIARRYDDTVVAQSKHIATFTADGITVTVWEFAPETETEEAIMGYYWTGKKTTSTKKPEKKPEETTEFTMQPVEETTEEPQEEETEWTITGEDQGEDQDTDWTISGDDDQGQDDGDQDTGWTIVPTDDTSDDDQPQDTGWTIGGQQEEQQDHHEDTDFTIGGQEDHQDDHQDTTDFTIGGGNDDASSAGTDFTIGGETSTQEAPVETIGDGWTIGGGAETPVEEAPASEEADTDWSI